MNHSGTITSRGFIPKLRYKGMDLYVKLKPTQRIEMRPSAPVLRDGFIVYALPGGEEYVSDIQISEVVR